MEFKHSPAPWNSYVKYLDYTIVRDANDKKITSLSYCCSEADANLITAAPKLLEALIELTESAKQAIDGLGDLQDAIDAAKVEIAKALGQQ